MNGPQPDAVGSNLCRAYIDATVRPEVRALTRYAVHAAAGLVKLDAMENPYELPQEIRDALAATLARVPVNRYPDGAAAELKEALAASLHLDRNDALIVGNGSDELIQIITATVAAPGATVLAPQPSFVMYERTAVICQARFVGVPLTHTFELDVEAMLAAISRHRPALVWLPFPNNPTGNLFDVRAIDEVIRAAPGLCAIDEAYYAYADATFLSRVNEFPNVVVVRTVSKIGMAGLRLGYAVAHPAWVDEFEKIRPPYNVNSLTQAAVPVLLQHAGVLSQQAAAIRSERARVSSALAQIPGVRVFATQTNFVLARVPDAGAWFAALRKARILVKNLDGWHPLLANCLRITVGTRAENDALLNVLVPMGRDTAHPKERA